jgi:hypothetical protein
MNGAPLSSACWCPCGNQPSTAPHTSLRRCALQPAARKKAQSWSCAAQGTHIHLADRLPLRMPAMYKPATDEPVRPAAQVSHRLAVPEGLASNRRHRVLNAPRPCAHHEDHRSAQQQHRNNAPAYSNAHDSSSAETAARPGRRGDRRGGWRGGGRRNNLTAHEALQRTARVPAFRVRRVAAFAGTCLGTAARPPIRVTVPRDSLRAEARGVQGARTKGHSSGGDHSCLRLHRLCRARAGPARMRAQLQPYGLPCSPATDGSSSAQLHSCPAQSHLGG